MQKSYRTGALSLTFAFLLCQPALSPTAHAYNFSPVNQYSLQVSARYWNPIVSYVSAKSAVPLTLKLGRTAADALSYVLTREADFAFSNHLFTPERSKLGWTVFGRRNGAPISAQIVVPADSPVRQLTELAGTAVGFNGPEGVITYKAAYAQLLRSNIPVSPVFSGNMDAVFSQLFSGKVMAAGANSQLVQNYTRRAGKAFRVLWSSPPLNDLALIASPSVPEREVRAVAQAFLTMHLDPKGKKILAAAAELVHASEPLSFVAATEADYAAYVEFYNSAPISLR